MKQKLIIAIIGILVVGGIGGILIMQHQKNTPAKEKVKEQTKQVQQVKSEKVENNTIGEIGGNDTNYNYPDTQTLGQYDSYVLPNYINDIEKVNYDTNYFWNTSMENINDELKSWYKKYQEKDIKDILDNEKNIPEYLVRLAVMHPEAIPYVAGYHGYKLNQPISLKGYTKNGEIPLFQQWDKQWGYDWYGNGPLAMDGCGPTSLSMIIVGLTGNMEANPRAVGEYSAKNGGYSWNAGSNQELFTKVAKHFGLEPHEVNGNQIIEQLKLGRPVMVSCHAGSFTLSGHIIVLSGVTEDGKIMINNPDSIKDSMETWSLQTILDNMNYAYSYSKA